MDRGALRSAPAELATRHLLALLEAELLERFLFQHLPLPAPPSWMPVPTGVEAFLHLYAPAAPAGAQR
jgi:hypothetical protein